MTSKRQFLDPISTVCKIILLKMFPPRTKIRITDHTLQAVPDTYKERMVYRPWIYGDSRDDMCALFSSIVRFNELYLNEKKTRVSKESSNVSIGMGFLDEKELSDESIKPDDCFEALKKIAEYAIEGIYMLEETYGYDNAVFTLQFYANILQAGIDGTYSNKMLPPHLRDFTSHNLLDVTKIKNLWKDANIIDLCGLFTKCFDALKRNDTEMVAGYKAAIDSFLSSRDEEFKKIVMSTESA